MWWNASSKLSISKIMCGAHNRPIYNPLQVHLQSSHGIAVSVWLDLLEKVNFISRYQVKDRAMVDEVNEYFKLPWEDFESCKPLQWWLGRCSQFPNLYQLVCDIFSIPGKPLNLLPFELLETKFNTVGSTVAVKWFFSGGRDTISLRRASLVPDTIWVLMLVKQRLRLAHISLQTDIL